MKPEIKLVVTDLDDTFTTSKYHFCPENARAIQRAQQAGVMVCACTARNWAMAKGQIKRAGFNALNVCSNGASIVEKDTGLQRFRARFDEDDLYALLKAGVEEGGVVVVYTHEQLLVLKGHEGHYIRAYAEQWGSVPRDLRIPITLCDDIEQMVIRGGECAEAVEYFNDHPFSASTQALLNAFSPTSVGGNCCMVMPEGISKQNGVERLAGMLGVRREHVMTIGDNANDLAMLKWAGLGVAVGNAEERVKREADAVVARNDRAGVARAIEMFVLGDGYAAAD